MSILINKNSRVLVQGFTGSEGTFHSSEMLKYGTNIVAGVTPGKGGMTHLDKPVFDSVSEAVKSTSPNVSIVFVPPRFAKSAIIESINAEVPLIVCITEGIPTKDMIEVKQCLQQSKSRLIGPNCPGIITPGEIKLGIMPGFIHQKGSIGVVSRSGTLTYEAVDQLTKVGLGQSTCIGIGGDPVIGTNTCDAVKMFMNDSETSGIVLIGEIGGQMENDAAYWIRENGNKPVVGFIAGQTAPPGRKMGHAGAIVGGKDDTALAKMQIMRDCGITVVESPADIGIAMKQILEKS
ncbi:MAG: succinate--CoA ligase subunit alpha [Flavobacteriales bacterium TMED191]|nr:MAG: succinate--CoA ligase subunit alpha [Flavobacteriales bacterium TMED191]|tara:strand:- start:231 stop:1106 length:876 start_codon:yes stop_codon:yes gene_type:complete